MDGGEDSKDLSVRDYIAIEAMKSYIILKGIDYTEIIASKAYRLADVMIEESNND